MFVFMYFFFFSSVVVLVCFSVSKNQKSCANCVDFTRGRKERDFASACSLYLSLLGEEEQLASYVED